MSSSLSQKRQPGAFQAQSDEGGSERSPDLPGGVGYAAAAAATAEETRENSILIWLKYLEADIAFDTSD